MRTSRLRQPLMQMCLILMLGIIVASNLDFAPTYYILSAVLVAFVGLLFRRTAWVMQVLLLVVFLCGAGRYSLWRASAGVELQSDLPIAVDTLVAIVGQPSEFTGRSIRLSPIKVAVEKNNVVLPGDLLLRYPPSLEMRWLPGDTLRLIGCELNALPLPRNPGAFNYATILQRREICGVLSFRSVNAFHLHSAASSFSILRHISFPIRQKIESTIDQLCNDQSAGLLKALLIGDRAGLDRETMQGFQNAGVIHVMAISGLHVGLIALILKIGLSFTPLHFKWRNIVVIKMLLLYMLMTGAGSSVVRATLMMSIYLIGEILERRRSVLNSMWAAALIILTISPQQLFDLGFQFSFSAVFAILFFYEKLYAPIEQWAQKIDSAVIRKSLLKGLAMPLIVSLAAQIGTTPFSIYYFGKIPLLGLPLNIIIVPTIGMVVLCGILMLMSASIAPELAQLLAAGLDTVVQYLISMVVGLGELPFAYVDTTAYGILPVLMSIALLMFILIPSESRLRPISAGVFLLCISIVLIISLVPSKHLDAIFLDVGQGDSALIRTPGGKSILIDAGPVSEYRDSATNAIIPAMRSLSLDRIDHAFISHLHLDHLGGIFGLAKAKPIERAYLPGIEQQNDWMDSLATVLGAAGTEVAHLQRGDAIEVDSETMVYVFGPSSDLLRFSGSSGHSINNASLVLLLVHRGHKLLFMGDAEVEAENQLNPWGKILKSKILKIGHHGSRTSTTEALLEQVQPEIAIISVGEGNKFRHPSPRTLAKLESYECRVFRTDRDRAVWLRLNGDEWGLEEWSLRQAQ